MAPSTLTAFITDLTAFLEPTLTATFILAPSTLTVIRANPFFLALTTPVLLTVATDLLDVEYFTTLPKPLPFTFITLFAPL